eukprot:5233922-Amphidinium_carterae.1
MSQQAATAESKPESCCGPDSDALRQTNIACKTFHRGNYNCFVNINLSTELNEENAMVKVAFFQVILGSMHDSSNLKSPFVSTPHVASLNMRVVPLYCAIDCFARAGL